MNSDQSDARKRAAEKAQEFITSAAQVYDGAADQPPTLPDTSSWVRRAPGDVIEAGTRVAIYWPERDEWAVETLKTRRVISLGHAIHLTPPPAPFEPWSVISTDRDKPTDAWVTFANAEDEPVLGRWFRDETGRIACRGRGGWGEVQYVISVKPVAIVDPETHVPVERALIDEVKSLLGEMQQYTMLTDVDRTRLYGAETALASLASDESSDTDGGRS